MRHAMRPHSSFTVLEPSSQAGAAADDKAISRRSVLFATAAAAISAAASNVLAGQPDATEILGVWIAEDGTLKLEMFASGRKFYAHLLYGNEIVEADGVTFKTDLKNPDASLRSRSLKGIVFIKGLTWNDGAWSGGSLYDGSSGRTYDCRAEFRDGRLYIRGYLGVPAFGRTTVLKKVSSPNSGL